MPEYRHFIARKDHGVAPRTLLRGMLVFAVGIVLSCFTISIFITDPYWKPSLGVLDDKISELDRLRGQVDVVFIGPSHIQRGIDCAVFDQTSDSVGEPVFSYNLSLEGSNFVENRYLFEQVGRLGLEKLRFIFYEPRIKTIYNLGNLFSARARFFSTFENVRDLARVRWSSPRSRLRTFAAVGILYTSYAIRIGNLGVLSEMLPRPQLVSDAEGTPSPSLRGFVPYARPHRDFPASDEGGGRHEPLPVIDPMKNYRPFSEEEIAVVLDDLKQIERMGAIPILLFPPALAEPGLTQSLVDALRKATPNTRVLDYHLTDSPHPIYSSRQYWYDNDHMNLEGAAFFSDALARDWAKMINEKLALN